MAICKLPLEMVEELLVVFTGLNNKPLHLEVNIVNLLLLYILIEDHLGWSMYVNMKDEESI